MNRLTIFGVLLLFGVAIAQEITTLVPDAAEQEEEVKLERDEPDSAENTIESESTSELIELIERLSLQVSSIATLNLSFPDGICRMYGTNFTA